MHEAPRCKNLQPRVQVTIKNIKLLCRPVLHLVGDLDGQARFSKLSVPALDSAVAAYKLGPRCGAVRLCQFQHSDPD